MLDLSQFSGTEQYHKFCLFSKKVCTDGVMFLFQEGQCFWLGDIIASYQPKLDNEPFQVWTLKKEEVNDKWLVKCEDGNGNILITQIIEYSDFEEQTGLNKIEIWLEGDVLLLPGEH